MNEQQIKKQLGVTAEEEITVENDISAGKRKGAAVMDAGTISERPSADYRKSLWR